ncbi:hypothetical protein D4R75_13605 [bacterium]|nr:MAG: hypothetical protein D4R75_13605 [bacterium]
MQLESIGELGEWQLGWKKWEGSLVQKKRWVVQVGVTRHDSALERQLPFCLSKKVTEKGHGNRNPLD